MSAGTHETARVAGNNQKRRMAWVFGGAAMSVLAAGLLMQYFRAAAGQAAAGAALVAAAGDAGAAGVIACAKSGAQKRAGTINDATKNDLQMRLVFMRTLYQIQSNACRALA